MSEVEETDTISLLKALTKFQSELGQLKKEKVAKGQKFSYNYASLGDVIEHCRKGLAKNKLAFVQIIESTEVGIALVTRLYHESGGCIESYYPLPDPRESKPQDFGSQLTYARRYSLTALLGVEGEHDDDAQLAQSNFKSNTKSQVSNASNAALSSNVVTDKQRKFLFAKSKEFGLSPEMMTALVKKEFGYESSKEIKKNEVDRVLELMQRQQDYMQGFKKDNEEELKNFAPGSDDTGQDLGPPPFDYDEEMPL